MNEFLIKKSLTKKTECLIYFERSEVEKCFWNKSELSMHNRRRKICFAEIVL